MNTFIPHIIELRKRLLRSLLLFFTLFFILFWFDEKLYSFVAKPLLNILPAEGHIITSDITTPFTAPLKLAAFAAIILAFPGILYELWMFIAPGLYRHERKNLLPLIVGSTLCFYSGMLFGYAVICPLALKFFINTTPKEVLFLTDMQAYLQFVLTLVLSAGIVFQVPIITVILIRNNILSIEKLTSLRRYIIVGSFVVGMILAPPDVISQTLLALPMWWLFELGLLWGRWWGVR